MLVAAAVDEDVVVSERAGDDEAVLGGPAERVEPVAPERGRALRVVVVPERHERVGLRTGRELLHGRAHAALGRAADPEVADREDAGVRCWPKWEKAGRRAQRLRPQCV